MALYSISVTNCEINNETDDQHSSLAINIDLNYYYYCYSINHYCYYYYYVRHIMMNNVI